MNVFLLELRTTRKSAMIWTVSISAAILAMLAFFPSFQTEAMQSLANAKLEGIDPALLAALGVTKMTDFTVITNFFGYVLQYIVLALMVYVTQHTVGTLIKEESDGTIEFLYAKPVSRGAIFLQKLLAHITLFIAMLIVFCAVTTTGYMIFGEVSFSGSLKESATFYGAILFVGIVFLSVGMLVSTLMGSNKGASGVTVAIVFGTFLLGIASVLIEALSFLKYCSPMDWIKTQKLMTDGILAQEWATGIIVIAVCLTLGYLRYQQKDLLI